MFPGSGGHLGAPRAEAICRGFLNSWMDPYERDSKTGAASGAAAEVSEEMEGTSLDTLCLQGAGGCPFWAWLYGLSPQPLLRLRRKDENFKALWVTERVQDQPGHLSESLSQRKEG